MGQEGAQTAQTCNRLPPSEHSHHHPPSPLPPPAEKQTWRALLTQTTPPAPCRHIQLSGAWVTPCAVTGGQQQQPSGAGGMAAAAASGAAGAAAAAAAGAAASLTTPSWAQPMEHPSRASYERLQVRLAEQTQTQLVLPRLASQAVSPRLPATVPAASCCRLFTPVAPSGAYCCRHTPPRRPTRGWRSGSRACWPSLRLPPGCCPPAPRR